MLRMHSCTPKWRLLQYAHVMKTPCRPVQYSIVLVYRKFTFNTSSCLRLYRVERGWRLKSVKFDLLFRTNTLKQLQTTQVLSYEISDQNKVKV